LITIMRKAALLLSALLLCSCDKPPVKEMAAAEAALALARKADAPKLAPDRFKEAEAALAQAQQRVQAKDYRGALSSATDAVEKARTAAKAAASAITMAKSAVEVAQAEIQAKLEEVTAVRQEAITEKVPDEAFGDLIAAAQDLKQKADSLAASAAEDVIAAQKAGDELKAQAASLPTQFREALDKWQTDHPKRGKPVKKK
jgi:colicin import membrane protein